MKKKLSKIQTATMALVVGVGTYIAVTGHPVVNQSNDQTSSNLVMSRYSSQSYVSNAQQQWQQLQAIIQQLQEQEQQQIQQMQQQWQQQQTQQWQQLPQQTQQQQTQQQQTQQQQQVAGSTSLPANTQASENWSGYIDSPSAGSNGYTSVSGSWKVPNVSSNQRNAIAAQWIGLGGVSNQDLLQMGTTEEIQNGQPVADIFWEKLPDVAQNVMTVPIGSTINASISQATGSTWNINFTVKTPSGKTQSKTIPVTLDSSYAQGIGTSAEWISEDPSNQNGQLYPMANMGTVTYNAAKVDGQAFTASGNQVAPVALISGNGNVLLAPSEIGADGQSFSTKTVSTNTNSSQGYGNSGSGNRRGILRSAWGSSAPSGRGHHQNYGNNYSETFTWTW